MDASAPLFVLEVEGSQGTARMLRFQGGHRQDPISIGTAGQWVLVGPGVRDLHGYVAFDGNQLFVQSASPYYPLRVDGAAVAAGWQAVAAPARIAVGGVTLSYAQTGGESRDTYPRPPALDEERTRFQPVDVPQMQDDVTQAHVPSVPYEMNDMDMTRPGVPLFGDDQDKTRVNAEVPPELLAQAPALLAGILPAAGAPPPHMPPAAGTPTMSPTAPGLLPSPFAPSPALPPPQSAYPAQAPYVHPGPGPILDLPPPAPQTVQKPAGPPWRQALEPVLRQAAAQWKETSTPKKAVLFLLPFAFFAVFVIFDESPKAERAGTPAPPATSAVAAARPVSPKPTMAPTTPRAPVAPAASSSPTSAPAPVGSTPAGGKSPERLAVDAVAAGEYADAVRRYEELSREHADQPAYREAARILRAKLDGGAP